MREKEALTALSHRDLEIVKVVNLSHGCHTWQDTYLTCKKAQGSILSATKSNESVLQHRAGGTSVQFFKIKLHIE